MASLKHLKSLNSNSNYYALRSYSELQIGAFYKVLSAELKPNTYGVRLTVVCEDVSKDDDEEVEKFLVFLSPSWSTPQKLSDIQMLLKTPNTTLFLVLEDVKRHRDSVIPIYSFKMKSGDDEPI